MSIALLLPEVCRERGRRMLRPRNEGHGLRSDNLNVNPASIPQEQRDLLKIYYVCAQSNSCDPMNHSPPGSSVHGILQARMLEWVAMPFSRGSS